MKIVMALLLMLSLSWANADRLEGSPVTKVVRMLRDLEEKLEKEAENEKDLYDKFRCWGTSTIDTKTKSIQDAEARIKYLTDYIADITGGKITFTMNKDDLEKEYASIHANLLNTTAVRQEENAKFLQSQANEKEAIAGLGQATQIIQKAAPKQSMLLSLRGASSARARLQQAKQLQKALDLGDQYLSKANAVFLRRILTGQAQLGAVEGNPAQTDITSQYESRTDEIVKKLTALMETFQTDLKLLQRSELKSFQAYVEKHKNQEEQEQAVKAALAKLAKEKAAREQAKVQSQQEIDDLTAQNKIDKDLISKITASMKEKAAEWDKRTEYRQGELKALGEGIEVLTSDDARDAFHASATNFLQIASTASQRARLATQVLRSLANTAKDHRLVILAARLSGKFRHGSQNKTNGTIVNPTFDAVLKKIDDMKKAVESEETSDLATKEKCEADLANNTARKTAEERGIENDESTMSYSTEKIDELNSRIAKVNKSIVDVQEQLAAAKKLREAQNAEFKQDKAEDTEAIRLIELATKKITDFYAAQKKAGSFLQQPLSDTLRSAGGETPWDQAAYTGAGSQASGVTEMMKMVADDIRKDILEAEKDESEAEAEYQQQKKELESEKSDLETARSNLRVKRAGRTTDLEKAEDSKDDHQGELKAVLQLMADVKPKCDFYLQNYEVRSRNRLTELKGLDKAKSILKGSFFEDTDRELKPGDS
eukprot:TRINITY_DN3445_c0_g1_i1.p1 TRINITY_DN3445_c0_g1~~TRINITY_DN3445_c0_g1_i1.p1  ORF type:complete len:715 (+),score=213.24 TRINITY_DN3445_c0_g1_i1:60-2204(+)